MVLRKIKYINYDVFKTLGTVFSAGLILNINSSTTAQIHETDWSDKYDLNPNLLHRNIVAQTPESIFSIIKLAGSEGSGSIIKNQDKSLACSLQKWQLIGIFSGNQIQKTKGELTFTITNHGTTNKQFVLAELIFLNDLDRPLEVFNPHRELQGEFIKLTPLLKPGETREYTSTIWYKSNWHKVELKTCRWLERSSDYWKIYPELKPKAKK